MATLVTAAGKMVTAARSDDDFADRLNFRYTTAMLVVFSVLITSKQYVGQPIQCWAPEHFSKTHVQYVKDFCWIRNTYFLPYHADIPREGQVHTHTHTHTHTLLSSSSVYSDFTFADSRILLVYHNCACVLLLPLTRHLSAIANVLLSLVHIAPTELN